jgi:hypothetical protein
MKQSLINPSCRKNYQHPLSYIHGVVLKININCLSFENNTFTNDAAISLSATTPAKRCESGVTRDTLKLLILLQPPILSNGSNVPERDTSSNLSCDEKRHEREKIKLKHI